MSRPPLEALWRTVRVRTSTGDDDQVDALGLIGQILDRMSAGPKQEQPRPLRGMFGMSLDELWTAQPKRSSDQRI